MAAILVCQTLEDASNAARYIKYSCRVVTLDGEMINPGGIIRGGSLPKRNAGMPLGRRKEIEELQSQKNSLIKLISKDEAVLDKEKKNLAEAEREAAEAAKKKRTLEEKLVDLQKKSEEIERETGSYNDRLKAASKNLHELESEETELNQRLDKLGEEIEKCTKDIENLENELTGIKEEYRQYLEEKNSLEKKITEVLVKISSYKEQCDSLANRIEEIDSNIKLPAAEKQEKNSDCEQRQKDLEENRQAQQRISADIEQFYNEKAALIPELEKVSQQVSQCEAGLIELEEKGRRRQNQLSRQEKRERQLSVEQTRLQTEINYQEMRFREQFQNLDLVMLDEDYKPEESKILVDNLKEDIEALGEVNLGAIDELERLEERINFLKEQKDDLQKGEASLKKVLAEIDQRMEYYFESAFETINGNFKKTFEELFEGGKVFLSLTDPDNMLESGIEIVAQPPGKKLQNITLLSAGEKVLTAIALVFAILRFKPAPFYLLDEVESTLDDANLARFTRFLKQTVQQAQFILITHRKRTMEEAEVLYGVTMPEPGVSRLMSLKIEDNLIAGESKK